MIPLQYSYTLCSLLIIHNSGVVHTEQHTVCQVGPWVFSGGKPQQPHTGHRTEGSICSKWPPVLLKWLDRHHSLSAHRNAWQTEHGHKEWIQLGRERKEEEAAGESEWRHGRTRKKRRWWERSLCSVITSWLFLWCRWVLPHPHPKGYWNREEMQSMDYT